MNRSAIIAIAGSSSRFSKSLGKEVHKAIYFENDDNWTILAHQIGLIKNSCNETVIITGYKHNDIEKYLKEYFPNLSYKLVYNDHYNNYGSCYSLLLGIEAVSDSAQEMVFLEGDLIFDSVAFDRIIQTNKNVITSNNLLIDARTAVIFYVTKDSTIKYLYDTSHDILKIDEPFIKLGNSGQVWKFNNIKCLKNNLKKYHIENFKGTNLVPINDYYSELDSDDVEIITFKDWFNCNTIDDYRLMKKYIKEDKWKS